MQHDGRGLFRVSARRRNSGGDQAPRFEYLEDRQFLSATPIKPELANAVVMGPFAPGTVVPSAVPQSTASQDATPLTDFTSYVVNRKIFYNQSAFDDGDPGVTFDDDHAIAPDKSAYIPTLTPTVTVEPYKMVAQGFPLSTGADPAPQDNRYFKGFPSMEILPSGRIVSVFCAADSHGSLDSQARWTYSDDGGTTWSTPVTLAIDCNGTAVTTLIPEFIYRIPSGANAGRLLLGFWNTGDSDHSRVTWSDDNGATWAPSVPAYDTNAAFSTYHYGGHPIQLADGSLLISGYAHVTEVNFYVSTTLRSTDGGQTWTPWSTIATGAGKAEMPEEPCMLVMDNGNILCTVREDKTQSIRTYISTDGMGRVWTPIAGSGFGAFRGFGRPSLVQVDDGAIIAITRDATTTYPIYVVSRDHGQTWSAPQNLGPDSRYFAYGDMRAVGNGRVAVIYGAQAVNTYVRSDVRFTYLDDNLLGNPASWNNMTSYSRGINGIMVDLLGTHGDLTASDFIFKMGNNNTPGNWVNAPAPADIVVRPFEGLDGSDRVDIVWNANQAPKNTWLQITVKGNDLTGGFNTNTGLAVSDVFYFGNKVGEVGPGSTLFAQTTITDVNAARNNTGPGSNLTNPYDFDRSASVTITDVNIARTNTGSVLKIMAPVAPTAPAAAPAVAAPQATALSLPEAAPASNSQVGTANAVAFALSAEQDKQRTLSHLLIFENIALKAAKDAQRIAPSADAEEGPSLELLK